MKKAKIKKAGRLTGALMVLIVITIMYLAIGAIGWFATCVIYKLATLVIGIDFSWLMSTGIWLLWFVPYLIFGELEIHRKKR